MEFFKPYSKTELMYSLAKQVLFRLDAETAHHVTLRALSMAHEWGLLGLLAGCTPLGVEGDESIEVMGLRFPNRIGLAAGLDKGGTAVDAFGALGFGHIEVGTVTPRPQPGNPKPRLFRLIEHDAIINRMGFNNPGTDGLLKNLLWSTRSFRPFRGILAINIGKNFDTPNERAVEDYLRAFSAVYARADYVTANLSSPNTKGLRDLQSVSTCRNLICALQERRERLIDEHRGRRVPIVIKIAPDLSREELQALGEMFSQTQIDGVIATNTTVSRDKISGHPLADETGGLSGAPLREKAEEVLAHLRKNLAPEIPIIASGGIMSASDAHARIQAGAALVQIYTGLIFRGPALIEAFRFHH